MPISMHVQRQGQEMTVTHWHGWRAMDNKGEDGYSMRSFIELGLSSPLLSFYHARMKILFIMEKVLTTVCYY